MPWLSLITGLIKLAGSLAEWAKNQQLISAGEAKAIVESTRATMENVEDARKAHEAMRTGTHPDWAKRVRDKYTRK